MSRCGRPYLCQLPQEITTYVVEQLDVEATFHLGTTCKYFWLFIHDNSLCEKILTREADHAAEAIAAHKTRDYSRALRILAKRRLAVANVTPYQVATVASAQSFVYCNGTLVYTHSIQDVQDVQDVQNPQKPRDIRMNQKRLLRVLDLHGSSGQEFVVDIRQLLDKAVPESLGTRKYKFHPIYYADGIVTCRYTHHKSVPASWLVVFNVAEGWHSSHPLDSVYKLFVRNNRHHLYFGTHSYRGSDGHRRWVLGSCDLAKRDWAPRRIFLLDMAGSDLGSTVCFEIFGNHLYAVSNEETFDDVGTDYSSYYYVLRFPLSNPSRASTEIPSKAKLWRRKNADGALDDRWTSLQLASHESKSRLKIIESRKEWLPGKSGAQRTYYSLDLPFDLAPGNSQTKESSLSTKAAGPSSVHEDSQLATDIRITAGGISKPAELGPLSRSPHNVHPGDNSSALILHTHGRTPIRSYFSTCSTFLDVVDDHPADNPGTQRVRIRAGYRRLRCPAELGSPVRVVDAKYPEEEINRLYRAFDVVYWPPEPVSDRTEPWLAHLSRVLNPPSHPGYAPGISDQKSLILATGAGDDDFHRLIFISFDSSLKLPGFTHWRDMAAEDEPLKGATCQPGGHKSSTDTAEGKERGGLDNTLRRPASGEKSVSAGGGSASGDCPATSPTWAWVEDAMYQRFGDGIEFFGREPLPSYVS